MFEDQPIRKPDPKQWQEMQIKAKEQRMKAAKRFLQKGNPNLLPCYKENENKNQHQNFQGPKKTLTKAQEYQQIKARNLKKFGPWDKPQPPPPPEAPKLHPSKMTISYKSKPPKIDTTQYKKPGYIETQQIKNKKKRDAEQLGEKMEYKSMIEYMKKLYGEFEREKEEFQREREYLKFKKVIEKESGLHIKSKVNTGLGQGSGFKFTQSMPNFPINKPEQVVIQAKIQQDPQIDNPNEPTNPIQIKPFYYPIDRLHECNPFTLKQLHKYVNLPQLVPQQNSFYKQAKKILQSQPTSRPTKTIRPKCTHGSKGANHSTCQQQECLEKRVSKLEEGWFQLWVPGRYRTVYNEGLGFKLVWYCNGDIKQEFTKNRIQIYHAKEKRVVQVRVGDWLPFWYYPAIGQLEMKDQKGNVEVIFADGRHEILGYGDGC